MTDTTDALLDFLGDRYDEEAATARSAFADHNEAKAEWAEITTGVVDTGAPGLDGLLVTGDGPISRHIARWSPARALRDDRAKRRLLTFLKRLDTIALDHNWWIIDADEALKAMALPYANHPDYQKEWNTP